MASVSLSFLAGIGLVGGAAILGSAGIIGECLARLNPDEQTRKISKVVAKCLQAPAAALVIGYLSCAVGGSLLGLTAGVGLGVGAFIAAGVIMTVVPIVDYNAENKYIRWIAKIGDLGVSIITKLSTVLMSIVFPYTTILLGGISLIAFSGDVIDLFRG